MHRVKKLVLFALLALAALLLLTAGSCESNVDQAAEQRKRAVKQRTSVFAKAEAAAPAPDNVNFPLRKALVEFTERQDLLNHPWYTYILGENGNAVGYFVSKTVPINACDFLSSTENIHFDDSGGNVMTTAPSLDGIFYGGGGASAGCDSWFFFDATTDALVQIRGVGFFTADEPLRIDAKPIKVAPGK